MVDLRNKCSSPTTVPADTATARRCKRVRRNRIVKNRKKFANYNYQKLQHGQQEEECEESPFVKKRTILILLVIVAICVALGVAGYMGVFKKKGKDDVPNPTEELPPSRSKLHVFSKAAVCADGPPCAEIGRNILDKNGTAVDAAIATLFCNGLINMQSMGLGGGFLMTIYIKEEGKSYTLNAREAAPFKASKDMFGNDPMKAQKGPLSIGVPGELRGYWTAHQRFGKLPWKDVVQPSVDLCERGWNMSLHQHDSIRINKDILKDVNMKKWFTDSGHKLKSYSNHVQPQILCETLKVIAEKGGDDLYNGSLAAKLAEDLKEMGSIITEEDLKNYTAIWEKPITVGLREANSLHTMPLPGSGVLLGFILNILDGYNFTKASIEDVNSTVLTYHRMVEAFKYAYAKRTELGDLRFNNISDLITNLTSKTYAEDIRLRIVDNSTSNEPKDYGAVFYNNNDHGTAHVSILAENGDAVSVTSTVNYYFGCGSTSKQTGIILNSGMDDFSSDKFVNNFNIPGSPNNAIAPGKRALSSMSPSIITDKNGDVKMVIGASGGTKITTAVALVIMRSLWLEQSIKEAVDAPRIHHQIYPMEIAYEYGVLQQIIDGLEALGHKTERYRERGSIICALLKMADKIYANADHRKGGDVFGL